MWRSLRVAIVTGMTLFIVPATLAQPGSEPACPGAPVSVYFGWGEASGSPQTQALIGRIGETALGCAADRIDLIAHIDAAVDGDRAVAIALQRLTKVAGDLVAQGLPAHRIRLAARAPEQGERLAGPNQIDVVIRKSEGASPPATPVRTARSQSI